ncbi:hypothetical protein L6164_033383 [Bauhinia variegata]|uniref:Uncharacterized protein n=1 Tax=Bauhinia variegata TaxID=167791 RepID=A0ACB9KRL3_BAUVA|nr:hypothetical protein L6164_033383 [Bauhinia variegata]
MKENKKNIHLCGCSDFPSKSFGYRLTNTHSPLWLNQSFCFHGDREASFLKPHFLIPTNRRKILIRIFSETSGILKKMEEYLQYMKTVCSQMNDVEHQAA